MGKPPIYNRFESESLDPYSKPADFDTGLGLNEDLISISRFSKLDKKQSKNILSSINNVYRDTSQHTLSPSMSRGPSSPLNINVNNSTKPQMNFESVTAVGSSKYKVPSKNKIKNAKSRLSQKSRNHM